VCTALDRIVALFVTHTTEEVQFGCPLGQVKAVVVHHGHQVHGAIGKTRVDELQESTDPTLAWRSEFGSAHD
jgi:hypothetical protein